MNYFFFCNYFLFLFDFNESKPNLLSPASSVVYIPTLHCGMKSENVCNIHPLLGPRILFFLILSLSIAIICLCETFRNVRKWFQTSRSHYGGILLLYTYVFVCCSYNTV